MNMLPYAEQILNQQQQNQWFIRFMSEANDLAGEQVKQSHLEWFAQQGLLLTEVRTLEYDLPQTNFYHVTFVNAQDPRLKAYSEKWEDAQGVSLSPNQYQMYEWSYEAWCENGLKTAWDNAHLKTG